MRSGYEIIQIPVITEKSTMLREDGNQYSFYVNLKANKVQIKNAIEKLYKVKVLKVNTVHVKGKKRRLGRYEGYTSERKKAFVTLRAGDSIKIFKGV